jgi:hypothetical protein
MRSRWLRPLPVTLAALAALGLSLGAGAAGAISGPARAGSDWSAVTAPGPANPGPDLAELRASAAGRPEVSPLIHAALQVSPARQALKSTLGVQVFWNPIGSLAEQETGADTIFNYVVGLGANTVGIDFFFATNGAKPTYVYGLTGTTPSTSIIAMTIAKARAHGLRVLIRPLMYEGNLGSTWRGGISPPNKPAWFTSYFQFLKPYLQTADAGGANAFDYDVELDSLSSDKADWTTLKTEAAQLFHGQLDATLNFSQWAKPLPWMPGPYPAVDAYPALNLKPTATVAQLTSAWTTWLHTRSATVLKNTAVQELGIGAVSGAYPNPWKVYAAGTTLDIPIQANWFAASCAAIKAAGMPGAYFFTVISTDQPGNPAAYDAYGPGSFIGRGDQAIKRCFASGWQ